MSADLWSNGRGSRTTETWYAPLCVAAVLASAPAMALCSGTNDTDGDGIPDVFECVVWQTNPNLADTDGDGLLDGLELGVGGDADPGSYTNPLAPDTDGDGVPDGLEDRDHDGALGDGETDPRYPDTDGDTIADGTELGPDPAHPWDNDGDGAIDARDLDSNGDGVLDAAEAGDDHLTTPPPDDDGDGLPNSADPDADGDLLSNLVEQLGDATGDGAPDVDADGDGVANRLDLDSDGDGKADLAEGASDGDGDGIANFLDPIDDTAPPKPPLNTAPKLPSIEVEGAMAAGLSLAPPPASAPSVASFPVPVVPPPATTTHDSDGDTLTDAIEAGLGTNPLLADSDGDGIRDDVEVGSPVAPRDTDADGTIDALELDSDGDAFPDALENQGAPPLGLRDTDGDGKPDAHDTDADDDGLADGMEWTLLGTDPQASDTDGGGVDDGAEVKANATDPLDPSDDGRTLTAPAVDPWAGAHAQGGVACAPGRFGHAGVHHLPLVFLVGLVAFGLRRERLRAASRPTPRRSTHRSLSTLLLLTTPLLATASGAQGLDGATVSLTAPGTHVLGTPLASTLGRFRYGAGLSTMFLRDPLVIARDGEVLHSIVRDRVDFGLHAAFGVWDFVDLGLDLPFVLHHDGARPSGEALGSAGIGDLRVWTRVQALSQARHEIDLGLVATLIAPSGDPEAYRGLGEAAFEASLLLGRRFGAFSFAFSAGYRLAPERRVLDAVVDDRLLLSLGATWDPPRWPFSLQLAVHAQANAFAPFVVARETNLESVGGLTWYAVGELAVLVGAGAGALPGLGTPTVRAFASLGWGLGRPQPEPERDEPPLRPPDDRDHDGIIDAEDKCPTEPEDKDGFEDLDGCPDLDNDADGIPDAKDRCRDVAEDKDGFEDEDGCPDLDDDGDGIPDARDKCPREPETKNGVEDDDGCPDELKVALDKEKGEIRVLDEAIVHFDWNEAEVPEDYSAVLRQIAELLRHHPEITLLTVEGHASGEGDAAYNLQLSRERASAVVGYLLHFGVPTERVVGKGYGASRMKVKAVGPKVNWVNRRVEFRVTFAHAK